MSTGDGKRPDINFHFSQEGKTIVTDVTIVNPLSQSYQNINAMARAQKVKINKYHQQIHPGFTFKPLVWTHLGEWSPEVDGLVGLLRKQAFHKKGPYNEHAALYNLVYGISIQIQKFNANMFQSYKNQLANHFNRNKKSLTGKQLKSVKRIEDHLSRTTFNPS